MQIIDFQRINKQGTSQFFRHWNVEDARAVVCIVHGLGEHVGRYGHVAYFFSEKGIATIGVDHEGHGRSQGKRGHAHSLNSLLDGIDQLLEEARKNYPDTPIFLYGHSMGGNLALNHVLQRKPTITGLIATAPLIRFPNPPPILKVLFGKFMSNILPNLTLPNGLDVNGLSNNPKVIAAYLADPLVHDLISVRVGLELMKSANWLDNYEGAMPCPTLLMHGAEDPITSPPGTEAFAKRTKGDVTWKRWEGLKHEIHNELQQGEVLDFLVKWMNKMMNDK